MIASPAASARGGGAKSAVYAATAVRPPACHRLAPKRRQPSDWEYGAQHAAWLSGGGGSGSQGASRPLLGGLGLAKTVAMTSLPVYRYVV